ncbi:MAG: hypothetical protein KKF65_05385, partial [Nanoarchaeota archaeon]|nr:hypothetical protein [Nanoarchaeota archaeon]
MKQKKLIWKQVTKNSLPPLILDFFIRELKNTFLRKLGFYYKYYKKVGDKGYIVPEADKEFVDELRKRARKDKNYLWNIYNMQYKDAKNLIDFSEELSKDNFKIKSDEELKQCFIQLRNNFFNYSYSLFLSVPRAPFLEDIVKKQLHKKLSNKKKIDEYFNVLMTPDKESNTGKAQKELLRIASSKNITKKLINSFLKKYSFLNVRFGYGKPYTYDDIVKRIVFLKRESPEKKLLELNTKNEELKEKRKKIIQELEFDEKLIDIINLARENSFFRTYNLETYSYVGCILIPFFNEVGKRVGLSYDELFYCTADEIISLLNNRIEIDNRKNSFVFAFLDGEANIFTGEKISFFEEKEIVDTSKFVFKGITASKGVVKGKARIVKSREDFSKMNAGDILVTEFTTPDYVTVMEKAAAIIADLGGLTSHTAVVARELGKPCIVGLVDASKVIKDDDIIEVDADKGLVIRKLNMKKLSTGDCKMNLFMYLFAKGFGKPQEKIIGYGHKNLVIVFNDKRTRFYMDPDELKEVGQLVISKMNNDFGFGMKIIEKHSGVG